MKFFIFSIFILSGISAAFSQEFLPNKQIKQAGNTYAVIIGIASYESKNIPNLNFSNRDARVFAEYLQSAAGGEVPPGNIRLLIDSNATTAAIYNALNWLREKCETDKDRDNDKEDLVYFYFSGHGDLETDTKANLGFLLSYNTPGNNFINNAVRLEDLNIYANTLSAGFNANVVLITDACHSGKLAGNDARGTYLVGKELSTVKAKEVRIAACTPEQLSQENEGWGGGRGVFSYYLVSGLKGLADRNRDSAVTLQEIQQYLDSCISNDAIMKENRLVQNPVLKGDEKFKLAAVNTHELVQVQQEFRTGLRPLSNQDYFFYLLKQRDRLESLDFIRLNSLGKKEIPAALITQFLKNPDSTIDKNKLQELEKDLAANVNAVTLFTESLVEILHNSGQEVINLYLEGDVAELERRRYYNSKSSGYDMYPLLYALALKLTDPDNPFAEVLKVNQYYFSGVAKRLKIPFVEKAQQRQLIEEALTAEKKALVLEDNAAYIYNEIGILSQAKMQIDTAERYFIVATKLAPTWAIPWANLSGLYAARKEFEKALKAGEKADRLQSGLQSTSVNFGLTYESTQNWLLAEEYYRKAIDINARHYYPFERLGYVYMNTGRYAEADSFYHEAAIRKKGYHFDGNGFNKGILLPFAFPESVFFCDLDTTVLKKDDIMAFLYWGYQEYGAKEYNNAVRIFKKIIAVDKTNPLVFHYLGKIFFDQQKWEEAEVMFNLATAYYLDSTAFKRYCDSVIQHSSFNYPHDCFEGFFRDRYYQKIENPYFLEALYESWGHYEEAEEACRKIIGMSPENIGGYVKLWRMLEKLGRYTEAEKTIQGYGNYDKEKEVRELNDFYRRAAIQFPEDGNWPYKLGLLLYDRASFPAYSSYLDTIVWFPLLNKELFIDLDLHNQLDGNPDMLLAPKRPGKPVQAVEIANLRQKYQRIKLPGTDESLTLSADTIYTPRKDAVYYLLKADSLLTEPSVKADINFKIGNIFTWSGSKKQAWPHYARSVLLSPENAGARLNLISTSVAIYKNSTALEQLIYLYDHQQLNFPGHLLLAEFYILSGQFEKGRKITEEAQVIYPYIIPAKADLMGRLNMVSNQPAQAIPFYKEFLATHTNDPITLYTIARLYARTNNSSEAWKWLDSSMKNGFNYSYILSNDSSWNDLRKTARWTNLMKRFPLKKYEEPFLP